MLCKHMPGPRVGNSLSHFHCQFLLHKMCTLTLMLYLFQHYCFMHIATYVHTLVTADSVTPGGSTEKLIIIISITVGIFLLIIATVITALVVCIFRHKKTDSKKNM